MLQQYKNAILSNDTIDPKVPDLLIATSGQLETFYAPFDHVNESARIVLLGITPGELQAKNALAALRSALRERATDSEALKRAKEHASFSGPMRRNLIALLDHLGMPERLGIASTSSLFDVDSHLVHLTSCLRNPVFKSGKNYSGSPGILGNEFLRDVCMQPLNEEINTLSGAYWIPLGSEPTAVLRHFAREGKLDSNKILEAFPHPSGANAERIAYFLGKKRPEDLSKKTNPAILDAAQTRLRRQISAT